MRPPGAVAFSRVSSWNRAIYACDSQPYRPTCGSLKDTEGLGCMKGASFILHRKEVSKVGLDLVTVCVEESMHLFHWSESRDSTGGRLVSRRYPGPQARFCASTIPKTPRKSLSCPGSNASSTARLHQKPCSTTILPSRT
jgi:hypothetical protein